MRPVCPHHPGTRMRLVSQAEPLFTHTPGRHSTLRELRKKGKDERLIYRCGIKACPRVEPHWKDTVEKKLCRQEGCKRLAEPRTNGWLMCKECYNEYQRRRQASRDRSSKRNA